MLNHLRFRRSDIVFAYPPESAESMIHVYMVWFPCGKVAFTSASDFHNGADCKMMFAVIFNNSYAVALLNSHVTPPLHLGAKFVAFQALFSSAYSNFHARHTKTILLVRFLKFAGSDQNSKWQNYCPQQKFDICLMDTLYTHRKIGHKMFLRFYE